LAARQFEAMGFTAVRGEVFFATSMSNIAGAAPFLAVGREELAQRYAEGPRTLETWKRARDEPVDGEEYPKQFRRVGVEDADVPMDWEVAGFAGEGVGLRRCAEALPADTPSAKKPRGAKSFESVRNQKRMTEWSPSGSRVKRLRQSGCFVLEWRFTFSEGHHAKACILAAKLRRSFSRQAFKLSSIMLWEASATQAAAVQSLVGDSSSAAVPLHSCGKRDSDGNYDRDDGRALGSVSSGGGLTPCCICDEVIAMAEEQRPREPD
jgi:hypothetical protein